MTFDELGLVTTIQENLRDLGYTTPTAIQVRAIQILLEGRDLLGIAQTGTGKTAAFALPIIQQLMHPEARRPGEPKALIIVPTRELCQQVEESFSKYAKDLNVRSCSLYGGVGQREQVQLLKAGVDVIVATPGRLIDLCEQREITLRSVAVLVLDEADRMLDLGFADELEAIMKRLPNERQNALFTATMPDAISYWAKKILKNPLKVEVAPALRTAENIAQKVYLCRNDHKFQLLRKIIKGEDVELAIVFTRTKNKADEVTEYLKQNRIPAQALHGDKNQNDRERALANFREGAMRVLVATDVAARGIDIKGISHVINFDLPFETENYVHRIGRTARAGKAGTAISFCDKNEEGLLEKIEALIDTDLPREEFVGKFEQLNLKGAIARQVRKPTPGKSQEPTAYLDHSKRQRPLQEGEKRVHPGFRKKTKRRK